MRSMSSPELHLIANAHLDPIWLWELADGKAEILQTFASAADAAPTMSW